MKFISAQYNVSAWIPKYFTKAPSSALVASMIHMPLDTGCIIVVNNNVPDKKLYPANSAAFFVMADSYSCM